MKAIAIWNHIEKFWRSNWRKCYRIYDDIYNQTFCQRVFYVCVRHVSKYSLKNDWVIRVLLSNQIFKLRTMSFSIVKRKYQVILLSPSGYYTYTKSNDSSFVCDNHLDTNLVYNNWFSGADNDVDINEN